MFVTDFLIQMP